METEKEEVGRLKTSHRGFDNYCQAVQRVCSREKRLCARAGKREPQQNIICLQQVAIGESQLSSSRFVSFAFLSPKSVGFLPPDSLPKFQWQRKGSGAVLIERGLDIFC